MRNQNLRQRLNIQKLNEDHLAQFNDLLRYAFQVTNQDLFKVGWENDEIIQSKSPVLEAAEVWGWFDGEKLASQIAVYPMHVNIFNAIYAMGGVTGVATYPEYANMGLMGDLMAESLCRMKEKGQAISFLYPYSIPFYRKKGWEIVSDKMTFSILDSQLPKPVKVSGMVERVPTEHPDIRRIHDLFTANRHGALMRDDFAWAEYWRWDVEDMVVAIYYDAKHRPMGYLVYLLEREVFKIKEFVYLNQEARNGIWNYISAHYSMVTEVRGCNYTGETIAFLLEDGEIKESIHPYMMARIVDFPAFIQNYPFLQRNLTARLHFHIEDPILDWNSGDFSVVCRANGRATCTQGKEGETVSLDIQTMAALLLGYRRPKYLREIERLQAGDPAIEILESLLPVGKPYFSDYF